MGQPRFLSAGLIALVASVAACGLSEGELLAVAKLDEVYRESGGLGKYRASNMDPSVRGTISGRVTAEFRKKRPPSDSDAFCRGLNPGMLREDVIIGADGGVANVIVYIKSGLDGGFDVPSDPIVLNQVGCQYVPHVAAMQVGQPLIIRNSDATMHNVKGSPVANDSFNLPMSTVGELAPRVFRVAESAPIRIECNVHGWMRAYIAVFAHPCYAVTGPDGTFRIEGVPPGTYQLAAWQESGHKDKRFAEQVIEIELLDNETKTQDFLFK